MKFILTAMTLLITLFLMTPGARADVYKWVDKNGTIRFSDVPPGSGVEVETIKTRKYPQATPRQESLALELEVEKTPPPAKKSPPKKQTKKVKRKSQAPAGVVIYTTDW